MPPEKTHRDLIREKQALFWKEGGNSVWGSEFWDPRVNDGCREFQLIPAWFEPGALKVTEGPVSLPSLLGGFPDPDRLLIRVIPRFLTYSKFFGNFELEGTLRMILLQALMCTDTKRNKPDFLRGTEFI